MLEASPNYLFLLVPVIAIIALLLLLTGTVLGWVAIGRIKRSQGRLRGIGLARYAAWTGTTIMLVACALLLFMLAMRPSLRGEASPGPQTSTAREVVEPAGQPVQMTNTLKRVRAMLVPIPDSFPEDMQTGDGVIRQVTDGVTWDRFVTGIVGDQRAGEIQWRELPSEGGQGHRCEVLFPLGDDVMGIELQVDDGFQQAVPSRVWSVNEPGPKLSVDRAMPVLLSQYILRSRHPAFESHNQKIRAEWLRQSTLSVLKECLTGILMFHQNHSRCPADLQELVAGQIMKELPQLENPHTGEKVLPLYHGGGLKVGEVEDVATFMLIASPFVDADGKRAVGFMDAHVEVLEEADYQARIKRQSQVLR